MTLGALLLLQAAAAGPVTPPSLARTTPFGTGERFEYSAKLGILSLGSAAIEVAGIDTVRGDSAWMFRFSLDAGNALFRINSRLESWTRTRDFHSLRFRQLSRENNKEYRRDYEVFGDSGFYRQGDGAPVPTVSAPLDDASVLYFIRTADLEVGKTYRFERYFKPETNPIVIRVLKRETMELPDGSKVPCLVLNPVVGDRMFAERAEARLWVTDDARRIPVQIRTRMFGTITLRLERIATAAPPGAPGGR